MNSVQSSVRSLMQMFDGKAKEFTNDINNVHMVWLEEIQQEANRMFSREFNAEPELMPKTPSQKKNSRRKRVSLGHQEGNQTRRRFSEGKRSNLRGSSVKSLNFIAEEENIQPSTSETNTTTQPKRTARTTRKNKQTAAEVAEDVSEHDGSCKTEEVPNKKPELVEEEMDKNHTVNIAEDDADYICSTAQSPPAIPSPEIVVSISATDRLSAEYSKNVLPSPGRSAAKIAIAGAAQSSRRSSVRCSLKLRHSLAGLRHSMTQESVRRASRRSMLKRKVTNMLNSTCSSNVDEEHVVTSAEEEDREAMLDTVSAEAEDNAAATEWEESPEINQIKHLSLGRITRSAAANAATLASPSLRTREQTLSTLNKKTVAEKQRTSQSASKLRQSTKRKAPDTVEESPTKRLSPPKKSQSAMRPNMRSFFHTVQKNRLLMETPNSLGRTAVIKSFIKHTTPLKIDDKLSVGIVTKERHKLEALKRKQELEEERMKKMDEEKKRKQDELKRKRDERLRRVFEAKVKEEQKETEKKKKIEQKMAQIDEKNDKRHDEKAKKKVAAKRQEELELKKKLEEESRKKKLQQADEEKRQQECLAKKKAEEEEQQRARKLAEARRALEQEREQERERERERLTAAERERVEKEKAIALQREVERAAREKERRELEERTKALEKKMEEQQRLAAEEKAAKEREDAAKKAAQAKKAATCLNVTVDIERSIMTTPVGKGGCLNRTVDIEQSPQSYSITPKGGNKPPSKSAEDYGMDQNSDDSTDDESAPRKPIPSWAEGNNLQQIIMKQYFNPPDLDSFFGTVEPPKLENIFYKSKPRYFKRTSSAVWNSPPIGSK